MLFHVCTELKDVPIHSMELLRHTATNRVIFPWTCSAEGIFATALPSLLHVHAELKDVPIHNMKLLQRMNTLEEQGTKFGAMQLHALHSLGEWGKGRTHTCAK